MGKLPSALSDAVLLKCQVQKMCSKGPIEESNGHISYKLIIAHSVFPQHTAI